jgi:carbon-monoxide dehydrogenase medium subunit
MPDAPRILAPRSVAEAAEAGRAGAVFGAGLTALQLSWGADGPVGTLTDLNALPGLDHIDMHGDTLAIGALVTLERLRRHPALAARWPALAALLGQVGALGVRNLATLGGNIAWGAGDLLPALLALEARLNTPDGQFAIAARPPGALILGVEIPPAPAFLFIEKAGFRATFSPSLVTVAAAAGFDGAGRFAAVRIALGGGPNTPGRIAAAEALVAGRTPDAIGATALAAAVAETGCCASDAYATAAHRADVAARLLAHAFRSAAPA